LLRAQLFGIAGADHFAPCAFFQLQAGGLGGLCAFLGRLGAFCKALGLAHLGNVGGGHFGQHVQHQLGVGHVVAQVFFFQALVLFVVADAQAAPGAAHQVGQGGIFPAFLHAGLVPFVGECFAHFNGFKALVDPLLAVAHALVVLHRAVDGQLGVCRFIQPLAAHLGQPELEGFSLGGGDGLD